MYPAASARDFAASTATYLANKKLSPPIVVGGVGGSGTRLIAQMLQDIGVFMGSVRNVSEDAMPFVPVYDNHINAYLCGEVHWGDLVDDLLQALDAHCLSDGIEIPGRWGWKNPRSIYLLPLLDDMFEGMRFIHVVRDGQAMATSENQAQLIKHGSCVLPKNLHPLAQTERALLLWSIVNNAAADYGKLMGNRYQILRYEDVCNEPVLATKALATALGMELPKHSSIVIQPSRAYDPTLNAVSNGEGITITSTALRRFGYVC